MKLYLDFMGAMFLIVALTFFAAGALLLDTVSYVNGVTMMVTALVSLLGVIMCTVLKRLP